MSVLEINGLGVATPVGSGAVQLIHAVDLTLDKGEMLCLVGESGSGKTVTGEAVLGLAAAAGLEVSGSIRFEGDELVGAPEPMVRRLRGRRMTLVPQDPMGSLDPVFTVGHQLVEAVRRGRGVRRGLAREIALDLLVQVQIPDPQARMRQYPGELSGGLCQRVLIAMALSGSPALIIADEPTSALDVTVQIQVLALLERARRDGTAVLCVTHDMGVGALADRVAVMYAGSLVEVGPAADVLGVARHPYTLGLIGAVPRIDGPPTRHLQMPVMPGPPASPGARAGCAFAPRCPLVQDRCREEAPEFTSFGPGHRSACWRAEELGAESLIGIGETTAADSAARAGSELGPSRRNDADQA